MLLTCVQVQIGGILGGSHPHAGRDVELLRRGILQSSVHHQGVRQGLGVARVGAALQKVQVGPDVVVLGLIAHYMY